MPKTAPDLIVQVNVSAPDMKALAEILREAVLLQTDSNATLLQAATQTAPVQATQTAPVQTAPVQTAPVQTAPVQTAPVQTAPVQATQDITLDAICNAGARLVEQGKMDQVIQLLGKYGVQAVNQIKEAQFAAFAADLRALGAQI